LDLALGHPIKEMSDALLHFMNSDDAKYDYQNFQILQWLYKNTSEANEGMLTIYRKFASDNNKSYYLRSMARSLLAAHGDTSDLDKLRDHLEGASSESEKVELICCLGKRKLKEIVY
jgi:hypothetical protein